MTVRALLTTAALTLLGAAPAFAVPAPTPCPGCWKPAPTTQPWQWQLQGKIDLTVPAPVYDIDGEFNSAATVAAIHAQGDKAICYTSVGTYEPFRSDAGEFPKKLLGRPFPGFEEERWLDIRDLKRLKPIMRARFDECAAKGFDAVEPDIVDAFDNKSGFPIKPKHQLRYNVWVANSVHARGMAVGLKNDLPQVKELVPYFDFSVNEQCFQYDECDRLMPFIDAGKAVFSAEYEIPLSRFCADSKARGFSTILKKYSLRAERQICP